MRQFWNSEQVTLTLACSPAFSRFGREGLTEQEEFDLARSIPQTALGPDGVIRNHGLGTTLSEIVDEAITLEDGGVSYDPEKVDALHLTLAALCGGEFDETSETAHELDLQAAGDETIEVISGPLYALVQAASLWGPHKISPPTA